MQILQLVPSQRYVGMIGILHFLSMFEFLIHRGVVLNFCHYAFVLTPHFLPPIKDFLYFLVFLWMNFLLFVGIFFFILMFSFDVTYFKVSFFTALDHQVTPTELWMRKQSMTRMYQCLIPKWFSTLAFAKVYMFEPFQSARMSMCHSDVSALRGWSFSSLFPFLESLCDFFCLKHLSYAFHSVLIHSCTCMKAFSNWLMFVQISSACSVFKFK